MSINPQDIQELNIKVVVLERYNGYSWWTYRVSKILDPLYDNQKWIKTHLLKWEHISTEWDDRFANHNQVVVDMKLIVDTHRKEIIEHLW